MRGDQRAWREEQEETREAAHVEKEQDRYFFIFNNKPHIQPHHLFDGEDSLDEENKAGNTANTSRGRVSRGGNACFLTFRLDHHGPTNQPTDGQSLL